MVFAYVVGGQRERQHLHLYAYMTFTHILKIRDAIMIWHYYCLNTLSMGIPHKRLSPRLMYVPYMLFFLCRSLLYDGKGDGDGGGGD